MSWPRVRRSLIAPVPEAIRQGLWDVKDVYLWLRRGKAPPLPPVLKHWVVKRYAARFGTRTLIETGTFQGRMVAASRDSFDSIYSIELDEDLYQAACDHFKMQPHIHLIQGDSGLELARLLADITEPSLFWLDAHYSGGITARGDQDSPIQKELQTILRHPTSDHVVLIDDAHEFVGNGSYPSLDELRRMMESHKPEWVLYDKDDVIRMHKRPRI